MQPKIIKILGREVPIVFNMRAQIIYERLCEKPFDLSKIVTQQDNLVLAFAAILAADAETDITLDQLMDEVSLPDYAKMQAALKASIEEWCNLPATLSEQGGTGDAEKNSSAPATLTD